LANVKRDLPFNNDGIVILRKRRYLFTRICIPSAETRLTGSSPSRTGNEEVRMPTTKVSVEISVSPRELWQLIGGFGSLPDWVPGISQSELTDGGRVRHLRDPQGNTFVEKLEHYDSADHSYSYSIVKSPVPVSDYLSTLQVTPIEGGKRSRVEWSSAYEPVGITEQKAANIFHDLYSSNLNALVSRYADKTR
jgi:hypothetical protein